MLEDFTLLTSTIRSNYRRRFAVFFFFAAFFFVVFFAAFRFFVAM